MLNTKYLVYTDGSCLNNGKKNAIGAIGIYFSDNDTDNLGQVIDNDGNKITNQTMELLACVQALKIIGDKIKRNEINTKLIYVYTDSTYIINSMTKWYQKWEKNGWKNTKGKDVENKELIQLLYSLKNQFIVIFKHIKSHQDEPSSNNTDYIHWYGNKMADKLATDAAKQFLEEKNREKEIDNDLESNTKSKSKIKKDTLNRKVVKNILNV